MLLIYWYLYYWFDRDENVEFTPGVKRGKVYIPKYTQQELAYKEQFSGEQTFRQVLNCRWFFLICNYYSIWKYESYGWMSHSVCFEYLLHVRFWMHQNERKLSRKLTTNGAKEQLNLLVVKLFDVGTFIVTFIVTIIGSTKNDLRSIALLDLDNTFFC